MCKHSADVKTLSMAGSVTTRNIFVCWRDRRVFDLWPLQTGSGWYTLKHAHVSLDVCVSARSFWIQLSQAVQLLEYSDTSAVRYIYSDTSAVMQMCVLDWDRVLGLCTNIYGIHHDCRQCVCLTWAHLSPIPLGTEPQGLCGLNMQVCVTVGQKCGCLCISLHLSVVIWLKICYWGNEVCFFVSMEIIDK